MSEVREAGVNFDDWFEEIYGKEPFIRHTIEQLKKEVEELEFKLSEYRMRILIKKAYRAAKNAAWAAWKERGSQ